MSAEVHRKEKALQGLESKYKTLQSNGGSGGGSNLGRPGSTALHDFCASVTDRGEAPAGPGIQRV